MHRALPRWKRWIPPTHLSLGPHAGGERWPTPTSCDIWDAKCHAQPPLLFTQDDTGFHPATDEAIVAGTHALLERRFYPGLPILAQPKLLRQFLQAKLAGQHRAAFFAFFLDRREQLIQCAELFRGTTSYVNIYPRELVRAALACDAEKVVCARTDPMGHSEPTRDDVTCARWLHKLFTVTETPLVDFLIVGKKMTSLAARGQLRADY